MIPYIGNGAYCYSNSISMLLAARGANISPSRIEPLTGVGLGAFWIEGADLVFFSSLATPPDTGISQALQLLGFDFDEKSSQEATPPPWESLRADLAKSPAILGPLDMGFLRHNPSFPYLGGSDHYVLTYGMDEQEICLHDPDGFPHVALSLELLEQAWKAENIRYGRGCYRYWTALQGREQPTREEIYNRAVQCFQVAYRESDKIASKPVSIPLRTTMPYWHRMIFDIGTILTFLCFSINSTAFGSFGEQRQNAVTGSAGMGLVAQRSDPANPRVQNPCAGRGKHQESLGGVPWNCGCVSGVEAGNEVRPPRKGSADAWWSTYHFADDAGRIRRMAAAKDAGSRRCGRSPLLRRRQVCFGSASPRQVAAGLNPGRSPVHDN